MTKIKEPSIYESEKFEKLAIQLSKTTLDIRLMGMMLDLLLTSERPVDEYMGEMYEKTQDILESLEDINSELFEADEEMMNMFYAELDRVEKIFQSKNRQ